MRIARTRTAVAAAAITAAAAAFAAGCGGNARIAQAADLGSGPVVAADPAATLRAGAAQTDITPPQIGYDMGGWTRADRKVNGQQTRLSAKALVLERGGRKVALVAAELFMIPGGLQNHVAEAVADLGFDRSTVLLAATHTHAGPSGFANYPTLNTGSPNLSMILTDPTSLRLLLDPVKADRQLYTFIVRQIASAIREADAGRKPAVAGWGERQLLGVTKNRSLEAHLANHGIKQSPRSGKPEQDPEGAEHTIDPNVDVLRVDQVVDGKRVPIGAWSQFADHGTVVPSETRAYSGDHHAAATRVFEQTVRDEAEVPADHPVVNVYGNGAEGDQSAGLDARGYAAAEAVGRKEAASMLAAWRDAGDDLSATPELDVRWTQTCFCGQRVEGGVVSRQAFPGVPFVTGSEEGRGPLYDVTKTPLEGVRAPVELVAGHGHKAIVPVGQFPRAVPLMTVRVGDRIIASLPGEPTKEAGARVKAAVLARTASAGVAKVVISGLTNEYINYITTPEEYDRQHYEGASTMYGRLELNLLKGSLADLSGALVGGTAAVAPADYDSKKGIAPDGAPYPAGATKGTITAQPASLVGPGGIAKLSWTGGPAGRDRPVGSAFVRVERDGPAGWAEVDSDLGLNMLWRVNGSGYRAEWTVPEGAGAARYRFVITATGYRLASAPFAVR